MKLMFLGTALNFLGIFICYFSILDATNSEQFTNIFSLIITVFWLISAIGCFWFFIDKNNKLSTTFVILGSIIFIPLGIIAIIGAIKLKNTQGVDLDVRRKFLLEIKENE